jgi:hypothetical protein
LVPRLRLVSERVESSPPAKRSFEARAWHHGGLAQRGAQVDDLLRRGLLLGLAEIQVINLLGEPDERGKGWLGFALFCGVRVTYHGVPHRLRVQFDRKGLVRAASVVESGAG